MFKTNFTITVARSFTRFTMIDVLARSNSDRDTTRPRVTSNSDIAMSSIASTSFLPNSLFMGGGLTSFATTCKHIIIGTTAPKI